MTWLPSRPLWAVIAILLMIAGCAATWMSATALRDAGIARDEAAFATVADENLAEIRTVVTVWGDIEVAARTFVTDNPQADQAALAAWATKMELLARHPDAVGISIIRPTGAGTLRCLAVALGVRQGSPVLTPALDHCAGRGASAFSGGVLGFDTAPLLDLAMSVPGGWVVITVDPVVAMDAVLSDDPGYQMRLHHAGPGGEISVSSGAVALNSEVRTTGFDPGWTLDVSGPAIARDLASYSVVRPLLRTGFGLSVLAGAMVIVLATGRQRAMRLVGRRTAELGRAHRALDTLLRESIATNEAVHTQFAQDLHDGPIQRLSALGLTSERLYRRIEPANSVARDLATRIRIAIATEISTLRHLMVEVRPPALDEGGVMGAISDLCARFESDTGIKCAATMKGAAHPFSPTLETILYRVLQRRLEDVVRFHLATCVQVVLETVGDEVTLTIVHEGAASSNHETPGLALMRHRALTAGGRFDAEDGDQGRFTVRLHLPLDIAAGRAEPEAALPMSI
jgi:two-component system sensor histidine kinase DegS